MTSAHILLVEDEAALTLGLQERLQRLQRLQRLEALGVMAGGIAHDFNNLLTPILTYAGLVRLHLPEDSPGHAMLDQIEGAARRASEITRQVLVFSGETTSNSGEVELSALVEEVVGALRSSKYTRARIQLQLATDLPTIEGDSDQVRQVVFNLLTNAVESLGQDSPEKSGHIVVRTGRRRLTREKFGANVTREGLPEVEYVFVEIVDTGCGMDGACLERIFEPFYTTKSEGRGLGLSAVLGIVRGHRGALFVNSLPGRGSTFEVFFRPSGSLSELPVAVPTDADQLQILQRAGPPRNRALLIDDEEGILKLLGHCLRNAGLEVLPAKSGAVAIELLRRHPGEVAIVVVDLQMPVDDGPATIRKLRAIEPNLPVILLSGCAPEEALGRCQGLQLAGVMQKPFNLGQLGALVAKVVESGCGGKFPNLPIRSEASAS